jgi:hypothetical protein
MSTLRKYHYSMVFNDLVLQDEDGTGSDEGSYSGEERGEDTGEDGAAEETPVEERQPRTRLQRSYNGRNNASKEGSSGEDPEGEEGGREERRATAPPSKRPRTAAASQDDDKMPLEGAPASGIIGSSPYVSPPLHPSPPLPSLSSTSTNNATAMAETGKQNGARGVGRPPTRALPSKPLPESAPVLPPPPLTSVLLSYDDEDEDDEEEGDAMTTATRGAGAAITVFGGRGRGGRGRGRGRGGAAGRRGRGRGRGGYIIAAAVDPTVTVSRARNTKLAVATWPPASIGLPSKAVGADLEVVWDACGEEALRFSTNLVADEGCEYTEWTSYALKTHTYYFESPVQHVHLRIGGSKPPSPPLSSPLLPLLRSLAANPASTVHPLFVPQQYCDTLMKSISSSAKSSGGVSFEFETVRRYELTREMEEASGAAAGGTTTSTTSQPLPRVSSTGFDLYRWSEVPSPLLFPSHVMQRQAVRMHHEY